MANFSVNEATCRKEKMTWGSALVNHTYKTLNSSNFVACVLKCDEDPQCRSCNFWWNKLECELNYAATYSAATSFIREVNCVHRDMDWEPGIHSNLTMSDHYSSTIQFSDDDNNTGPYMGFWNWSSATFKCVFAISLECPLLDSDTGDLLPTNTFRSAWCFCFITEIELKMLTKYLVISLCACIPFGSFWTVYI